MLTYWQNCFFLQKFVQQLFYLQNFPVTWFQLMMAVCVADHVTILIFFLNNRNTYCLFICCLHINIFITLHTKFSGAVYCYRSCLCVQQVGGHVCVWVCYHDNLKSCASIFTKLGLQVKVAAISNWLNFGLTAPPGRDLRRGKKNFVSALLRPAHSVCVSLSAFFIYWLIRSTSAMTFINKDDVV